MKKIYLFLFMLVISINLVSAFQFDNRGSYNPSTKTMSIKNLYGMGDTLAEIKLLTPSINPVMRGENRLVATMEFNFLEDSDKVFNNMDFYNLNRGSEKINRQFTYKLKKIIGTETIPVFQSICSQGTCQRVQTSSYERDVIAWETIDISKTLLKGKGIIGIFTDVEKNDRVEWIPTYLGVEINEWAVWTDSFNTGLEVYYNFDESSGTIAHDNTLNGNDLFPLADNWVGGRINNGYNVTHKRNSSFNSSIGDTNITINFWIRRNGLITGNFLGNGLGLDDNGDYQILSVGTNKFFVFATNSNYSNFN